VLALAQALHRQPCCGGVGDGGNGGNGEAGRWFPLRLEAVRSCLPLQLLLPPANPGLGLDNTARGGTRMACEQGRRDVSFRSRQRFRSEFPKTSADSRPGSKRGPPMSYLVHIGQAPLGVVRTLGSRVWFALPGVAGTLVAYSYFPQPTLPGQSQNLAGDDGGGRLHVSPACNASTHLHSANNQQTLWSSP
jgi:hypothetical protein